MDFWSRLYNLVPQPIHGWIVKFDTNVSNATGIGWIKGIPPVTVVALAFLLLVLSVLLCSLDLKRKFSPERQS